MAAAVTEAQEPKLGINPLEPPTTNSSNSSVPTPKVAGDNGDEQSTTSNQTPAHRRRERHKRRQQKIANAPTTVSPVKEHVVEVAEAPEEQAEAETQTPNMPLDTLKAAER